jgi:hypothetical protein
VRYTVRPYSEDGFKPDPGVGWCVWDNTTNAPAETSTFRYINLSREKAQDEADSLNNPE